MSLNKLKDGVVTLWFFVADCISWLIGLIMLTLSLILGMYAHTFGLGLFMIALLLMPFSRRFIEAKTACRLSWQIRMTLILVIGVLTVLLSPAFQSLNEMWHSSSFYDQRYLFHFSFIQ